MHIREIFPDVNIADIYLADSLYTAKTENAQCAVFRHHQFRAKHRLTLSS